MDLKVMQVLEKQPLGVLVSMAMSSETNFEPLMKRTHPMVRKIAAPLVPSSVVDDVVQETFLIVYRKLHLLRTPKAYSSWLSRIALSVCYQYRRKLKSTEELPEDFKAETTNDSPYDLRSALDQMKEKDRNILILRELLGLSYDEISEAIALPVGTVRSRLFYARKKLKELLQNQA